MPRGPERFFYDKSSYTGVAQKGGPSHYDDDGSGGYSDLSWLINRDHVQNDWLHRKLKESVDSGKEREWQAEKWGVKGPDKPYVQV